MTNDDTSLEDVQRKEYLLIRAINAFKTNSLTEQQAGFLTNTLKNGPEILKALAMENLAEVMREARDIEDKQKNQMLILKHLEILNKDKHNTRKEDRLVVGEINKYVDNKKARDPSRFKMRKASEIILDQEIDEE
jgi:hypothetical protein